MGLKNSSTPEHFKDVNYSHSQVIVKEMKQMIDSTRFVPCGKGVHIIPAPHCTALQYDGRDSRVVGYRIEVLGHLTILADMVAHVLRTGKTYYEEIGFAAVMCSAQDILVHGLKPDSIEDGILLHQYAWAVDQKSKELAAHPKLIALRKGFERAALRLGAAFTGGESASLRYLIASLIELGRFEALPSSPIILTVTHGSCEPGRFVQGDKIGPGTVILGARSKSIHYNGPSMIFRLPGFPEVLADKLSDGRSFGEALMAEVGCYMELDDVLHRVGVNVQGRLAASGGGVSKLAYDKRDMTYDIDHWPSVSPLFEKILELARDPYSVLKELNCDIGWFEFVASEQDAELAIDASRGTTTPLERLGKIVEGKRGVNFRPQKGTWKVIYPNGVWLEPQEA